MDRRFCYQNLLLLRIDAVGIKDLDVKRLTGQGSDDHGVAGDLQNRRVAMIGNHAVLDRAFHQIFSIEIIL